MTLVVVDGGLRLEFSFADLMRYHGPGSPGGVAHAYKVLERALPLLAGDGVPERREITVRTAFGGPGARDAFEVVLRAVTGERYTVDPDLARPERGRAAEHFVFVLGHRDREVTLAVSDGFVTDEFIDLARTEQRTAEQEQRLTPSRPRWPSGSWARRPMWCTSSNDAGKRRSWAALDGREMRAARAPAPQTR